MTEIEAIKDVEKTTATLSSQDSLVCYCYRLTTGMLKKAYSELGSLKAVEEATKAGKACTGCKVILQSLFGENASDHYQLEQSPSVGSTCKKPGDRLMKGFIVADGNIESTVYSSNGVAPQFGDCDADTPIEYVLIDHRGCPIIHRNKTLKTNETFVFKTKDEDLPRPFFGQFLLYFGRSNYGASRFNIYWGNEKSLSATHENSNSGRPHVVLPVSVDKRFLEGPNRVYLGIMNPHQTLIKFNIECRDLVTNNKIVWRSELPPLCSTWLDSNSYIYKPALESKPDGKFVIDVISSTDMYSALSVYFFFHNLKTDIWTVNHL